MSNAPPKAPKRLAEAMPLITAGVSELRSAFGDELIDDRIRRGRQGEPVFFAYENGISFGTSPPQLDNCWRGEELTARYACLRCLGACLGRDAQCEQFRRTQST